MSGLAAIGAQVGAGAMGGVIVIAAAPALLGVAALNVIGQALGSDASTRLVACGAGVVGGGMGTTGVIMAVSEMGTVAGLSGTGIASGLAALGGVLLAAGGTGMAGGLVVCAAVPLACVMVVGGAVLLGMDMKRESEYRARMVEWQDEGAVLPIGWNA